MPFVVVAVVVVAIVVAVGAGQGWFAGLGAGTAVSPSASVEGVVPADAGVVAEGRAVPVRWAEVVPSGSGRVTAIPVAVGDAVAAGDLLVQLDDAAAALEIETATAARTGAAAAVARAAAAVDQARAGVTQAQAAVGQAQAARRAADAARDSLPDAATKAQERQADAQVDQADAGVGVAQAQLASARAGLHSAQAALDAATADDVRAGLAVAAAELARDSLAVTSPIAGTVITIEPAVGDLAQPGAIVARVADLSTWRFETEDLSEGSVARVREGAAATITVDGLPDRPIAGTVESVGGFGTSVQGDITFRVVVAPAGEVPDDLRWNMTVTIEIEGEPVGG
jgi:multidrug resistance efflux pump